MRLDAQASRIQAITLTILTAIALGGCLYLLRGVLVPFVLALFLGIALEPVVDRLSHRLRLPHGLSVFATLALAISILVGFTVLVASSVGTMVDRSDQYATQLRDAKDTYLDPALVFLGLSTDIDDRLLPPEALAGYVKDGANATLSLAGDGLLVLIFLVFLMLQPGLPPTDRNRTFEAIRGTIRGYVLLKGVVSLVTALLFGLTLWLFGVELALTFAVLAFFLNFIPNVGPVIASLLPVPVILMSQEMDGTQKILALVLPTTLQFLSGNVVEPRVFGRSLDLNPVVVVFGLVFWGTLWGMVGVFLAVPLTVALKTTLEHLGYTAPIAEILADHSRSPSGEADRPEDADHPDAPRR